MLNQVELLSPAGNLEKLRGVLRYGADAVYLGGKAFNLRAHSHNFSKSQLADAVQIVHEAGKRVYITLNILAREREIKVLPQFISFLGELGVDAVIVADLGIMELVQEFSDIPIHVSTQASTTNSRGVKMWKKLGAKRVVLAREVTLDEVRCIKDAVPEMELEVFVHGAMCMAYSGRCQLSSYMSERDSNHGLCTNTCRWKYSLVEEKRPGEYYPVFEDETGSYIYNAKDLCTVEFLDQIIAAGVSSLKIEGRHRGLLYGATTTKVYREALDAVKSGTFANQPHWKHELNSYHNRGYSSGFYLGKLDAQATQLDASSKEPASDLAGMIIGRHQDGRYKIQVRNRIEVGCELEILQPLGRAKCVRVGTMQSEKEERIDDISVANSGHIILLELPFEAESGDIVRRKLIQDAPWQNDYEPDELEFPLSSGPE